MIALHNQVDAQKTLTLLDSDTQSSKVRVLMKKFNHSISWGGYRPGAGQKPRWRNGATATIRVPQVLVEDVMLYVTPKL